MPPALMTDYCFAYGDSGFILNTDAFGAVPFFDITDITGLDSAPFRTNTDEHQGTDGTYVDAQYMSMRTIVISGNLYTSPGDPESTCDLLRAQYGTQKVSLPLYMQLPGKNLRFINAKSGGVKYDIDTNRNMGMTAMQLTLLAGDPLIYDYPANVQAVAFNNVSGVGTGFNMSFNVGFGGTIVAPSVQLTNEGTHDAYPIITLVGPLTNPVISDSNSGIVMALQIALTASDTLVIDCRKKSITLDGAASRRSSMASLGWLSVPPGITDTFFISADSGTGTMSVQLYNTYY